MVMNHVRVLSREIGERPVGTVNNRRAGEYIRRIFQQAGLETDVQQFPCPEWSVQEIRLIYDGCCLDAVCNPFSPSCDVSGEMQFASSVEQLQALSIAGKILVLHGRVTNRPIVSKGNPFYMPEEVRWTEDERFRLMKEWFF